MKREKKLIHILVDLKYKPDALGFAGALRDGLINKRQFEGLYKTFVKKLIKQRK